jgi:hypothetical protein
MSWLSESVKGIGEKSGISDIVSGFKTGDPDSIKFGLGKLTQGPVPRFTEDPLKDNFIASNSSFSGTDCVAIAQVNDQLIVLGNVATFSYSIFREKVPVRVLGRSHPKGFTAGGRTIAGSIIFVVFDRSPLHELLKLFKYTRNPQERYSNPVSDQMPAIDLFLSFGNEYGHTSILKLYGIEIVQENQVHSINDIYSENTMQYIARDIDVMINSNEVGKFRDMLFERQLSGQFTDNLLASMLEHRRNVESKIADSDALIARINTETGRKNILTLGLANLGNQDLRQRLSLEVKKKTEWLKELQRIDAEIQKHTSTLKGWNAQNSQFGTTYMDILNRANVGGKETSATLDLTTPGLKQAIPTTSSVSPTELPPLKWAYTPSNT